MQEINSTIIIKAPKKVVWDILIDFEKYEEWNPFTRKVDCNLLIGSKVGLHVDMNGNGKTILQNETLLWVEDEESIAWGITSSFPVKTERAQILSSINDNTTEYHTYDKFWGVLVPVVLFFYGDKIQKGFDSIALALKERAEAMHQFQS